MHGVSPSALNRRRGFSSEIAIRNSRASSTRSFGAAAFRWSGRQDERRQRTRSRNASCGLSWVLRHELLEARSSETGAPPTQEPVARSDTPTKISTQPPAAQKRQPALFYAHTPGSKVNA